MSAPETVSIDGELLEPERATISALDDGLLRGDGAFEAIKLYDGHPFRLSAHLERLARSAAAIELPFDQQALPDEIAALLAANDPADQLLRVVLTRGGRRILLLEPTPAWPDSARIALIESSPSAILAGAKTISYATNMQATRIARRRDADEAVTLDGSGVVLEAPTSSVFWVGADGVLRTPALEAGILDSITRRVVVEAIDHQQGSFPAEDLRSAREAFLASTSREIQPIAAVDGKRLEQPAGGPATAEAAAALAQAVRREQLDSKPASEPVDD